MRRTEVQAAVMDLVIAASKECDLQTSVSTTTSLGALGMDSLKLVEIVFELETRFSVAADEELLGELQTVGDVIDMITQACEEQTVANF